MKGVRIISAGICTSQHATISRYQVGVCSFLVEATALVGKVNILSSRSRESCGARPYARDIMLIWERRVRMPEEGRRVDTKT